MKEKEILDAIKKIVTPYTQRKEGLENFSQKTDFIKDLEVNSANLVDVILDVEDEFNIEIDNESMEGMLTVGDAKNIIERKLAAA
jgi:acyl carrier protein